MVEGEPVYFDAADEASVQGYRGKLAGRIVLLTPAREFPTLTGPVRWSNDALRQLVVGPQPPPFQLTQAQRAAGDVNTAKWKLLFDEHPAVVIEPGSGEGGTVFTSARAAEGKAPWAVSAGYLPPQLVMAAEQYNRLVRLVTAHQRARLRIALETRFDADHNPANLTTELPGNARPEEVVMFGAPIDSWHAATGATDNARLVAYFNLDWGPGRIRGVYLDGRVGEADELQTLLTPLANLGAATVTPHSIGASDHVSFEEVGVPGFAFIRDFMETRGGPNHTNMDVYDRLLPADLQQAAIVTAMLVYQLAQETEPFPRD